MRKFLLGFLYAWQGTRYAFSTQLNFRFHFLSAILVFIASWYFDLSTSEWIWIICAISLVFAAELFNTAIEVLVDLVSPSYHHKAGIVKDLASAAVMFVCLFALITGLIIFVPKIF